MSTTDHGWILWPLLGMLAERARGDREVPDAIVTEAVRATYARFASLADSRLDGPTRRRVTAYFWGVVRRRAVRDAHAFAQEIVRATLATDLARSGRGVASIASEPVRAGVGG